MKKSIEFKDEISVDDFCKLRQSVGFQKITNEQAKTILSKTTFVVNAVFEEKSIGVVRVLTDTVTDAYITDVIINPNFQAMGFGKAIMNEVLKRLRSYSIDGVKLACSLYANPSKEAFYEKIGFKKLPNGNYGFGMLIELQS